MRLYFIVSDLNWNAALNVQKETLREDVGIIVSERTASLHPRKQGVGGAGLIEEEVEGAVEQAQEAAALPEVEQSQDINIGTIMRYVVNLSEEEESPHTPPHVVVGPDVPMDL